MECNTSDRVAQEDVSVNALFFHLQYPLKGLYYRELIMPPGVMSLGSNFGWLANHERGQSDYPVTMSKSAEYWGQLEAAKMIKSLY